MKTYLSTALGALAGFFGDGPWRSKSVWAALAVVMVGGGFWFSGVKKSPPQNAATNAPVMSPARSSATPNETHWDWSKPLPFYVPACASYVAGFCIGWFFRKVIRIVVMAAALVISLLAMGKLAGCDIKPAQERVKRAGEWAQHEASSTRDYLLRLLPSAAGGGAGVFLGFRRRSRTVPAIPAS